MTQKKRDNYGNTLLIGPATVRWSHLLKPDDKFGNPHHSVTIIADDKIVAQLQGAAKALGGKKINGFRKDAETGVSLMRFKNVLKARDGITRFPCVDASNAPTEDVPFATDIVNMQVTPALLDRDGSVSFYLGAIQLVQRNFQPSSGSNGFADVSQEEVPF